MSKALKNAPAIGLFAPLAKFGRPPHVSAKAILPPLGPSPSFEEYLDHHPVILQNMLEDLDQGMNKTGTTMLVDYLRSRGRELPVLAMLADWLDPTADTSCQLKFIGRRGKRRGAHRKIIKQAQMAFEVGQMMKRKGILLRQAIEHVAGKHGKHRSTVEAALTATKPKALAK